MFHLAHGYSEAVYLREIITAISMGVLLLCNENTTVVGLSAFHISLLPLKPKNT